MASSIAMSLRSTPRNNSLIFNLKKARILRAIRNPVTIRQFLCMNEIICAVFSTKNTQAVRKIPRLFENSQPRSSKWRNTQADNGMKPVPNNVIVSHQINISTFSMLLFFCESDRTNVSHSV